MDTTQIATTEPTTPNKAAKVWSVDLARTGWTPVPTAFFKFYQHLNLTGTEAMFLLNIVSFKRDSFKAFPSYKRLGERLGVGARRARAIAKSLIKKGYLTREERRRPGNRSHTNLFGVAPLIQRLEQLQAAAEIEAQKQKAPLPDV